MWERCSSFAGCVGAETGLRKKARWEEMEGMFDTFCRLLRLSKFKLRASARHRLAFDMAVLSSGLRPAVMVDYAGKASQVVQLLGDLLHVFAKECSFLTELRVLYLGDCVHLIHASNLRSYLDYTSTCGSLPEFVILSRSRARIASSSERQHIISACQGLKDAIFRGVRAQQVLIDLHDKEFEVLLPTANGWLLAYPVVYAMSREEASEAGRRLAMTDLHLYRVSLPRFPSNVPKASIGDKEMDLFRFSVPRELSAMGKDEPWMLSFLELNLSLELGRGLQVDVVVPPTEAVVL